MNVRLIHTACTLGLSLCAFAGMAPLLVPAARAQQVKPLTAPGPMMDEGTITLDTPDFTLKLVRSSQIIAALEPKGATYHPAPGAQAFDFTPGDLLTQRSTDGYYHLGDLDLRLRSSKQSDWTNYSTSLARRPVNPLPISEGVLAAADLAPTLPSEIPLKIVRVWAVKDRKLTLRFTLTNTSQEDVEIGSLGIPMVFNNVMNHRTLEQAHTLCSFDDPYIGEDAGYLQVTRLNGEGPALIVVPDGHTPFEAYNPILDVPRRKSGRDGQSAAPTPEIFHDLTPRGITFEGFYEWMAHSGAYQQNEWQKAEPWNAATTLLLKPGESRTYGVRFLLADSIEDIEKTLAENGRPVAIGVPGYILPKDIEAHLFLKYPRAVKSIEVEPVGAISITQSKPTASGYKDYLLRGKTWGRARISITYDDGALQTISYRVIKPEREAVADLGRFLTTRQWFSNSAASADPFHRAPSIISYDRQAGHQVLEESRVWIAGLSDEAGADSWLGAFMKESGEPNPSEIHELEQFIDGVLWGHLQYSDGPEKYGVRKSLFYYQQDKLPPGYYDSALDWSSWTSWSEKASQAVDRSFNYPHVASAYWVMYRLARNHPGLVANHAWQWYLEQAYQTTMGMMRLAPYYTQFGQMEGDVFVFILDDLKREGMAEQAAAMEAAMRRRAEHWNTEAYPFGSEMPWDSTGQEEVYAWTSYFGFDDKADVTLRAILGYDPAIPGWGYNGSARRYWDFLYAGKYARLERQLQHYGSGINAIPLLAAYRKRPDDLYLLRVGYGGTMGELSNIDQEGFGSEAFHAFPDMLAYDPYSGDYGSGFWGFAANTATYVVNDPALGWLAFGGNLKIAPGAITVTPLDAFRSRLYLAPVGLWLTLDAGEFREAVLNTKTGTVRLSLEAAGTFTPQARLRIEQPARIGGAGRYAAATTLKVERGAYVIPLASGATEVVLRQEK